MTASLERRGLCFVLAAPSGAGKSTIARGLLADDDNLALSVSVTTRAARPNEVEGVHYFFRDAAAFDAMVAAGELLEWARVFGRGYGTPRSPVLAADARHLSADVMTSAGIVLGVGVAVATGQAWLDPAVAAGTAIYVLVSGLLVIGRSVGGLMDEAPPTETMDRIRAVVGRSADGAIEAHDLRTRHAGRLTYLEFHLVVPADMTVSAAHEICDRIEGALKAEMADVVTTIHLEPPHKAKHSGVVVV